MLSDASADDSSSRSRRHRVPRALKLTEPPVPKLSLTNADGPHGRETSSSPLEDTAEEDEGEVTLKKPSVFHIDTSRSVRKISSGASLTAMRSLSHTPSTAASTCILTPVGTLTDDSDDSYVSAYSVVSPASGKYNGHGDESEDSLDGSYGRQNSLDLTLLPMDDFGKRPSTAPEKALKERGPRERSYSTRSNATATDKDRPSPTLTEHTVVTSSPPRKRTHTRRTHQTAAH